MQRRAAAGAGFFNPLPETAEPGRQAIGLLRFRHAEDTKARGGFLIFGRHSIAATRDIPSDELYAVDFWFFDNGVPAVACRWKSGKTAGVRPTAAH
ncbi:MAG TPA: hypothetical protein VGK14_09450 [Novimethylophilus sp.]|uniref:hypothetical protein n=1 Tax=Novimethylophilus sp. TaxID=2137426 RepID=UPI002F3E1FBB